jgi:hypothetical protein
MKQAYNTIFEYDNKIKQIRKKVLIKYIKFEEDWDPSNKLKSLEKARQSLDGKIGDKDVAFANIKKLSFNTAEQFRNQWLLGLYDSDNEELKFLFQDKYIRNYILLLLEKRFLKNQKMYRKIKLKEYEREIYLGENNCVFGVFIAPINTNNIWKSYYLKGLKVPYTYLTVGQIIDEGILKGTINADSLYDADLLRVSSRKDIINIYNTFSENASSYERKFIEEYINMLQYEEKWKEIPLLLPEVRYDGIDFKHKYRIDFMIINMISGKRIGIELSPYITHTQDKETWRKEMAKRNEYLKKYNISIITFTDKQLEDIGQCFKYIKDYFFAIETEDIVYEEIIKKLIVKES